MLFSNALVLASLLSTAFKFKSRFNTQFHPQHYHLPNTLDKYTHFLSAIYITSIAILYNPYVKTHLHDNLRIFFIEN